MSFLRWVSSLIFLGCAVSHPGADPGAPPDGGLPPDTVLAGALQCPPAGEGTVPEQPSSGGTLPTMDLGAVDPVDFEEPGFALRARGAVTLLLGEGYGPAEVVPEVSGVLQEDPFCFASVKFSLDRVASLDSSVVEVLDAAGRGVFLVPRSVGDAVVEVDATFQALHHLGYGEDALEGCPASLPSGTTIRAGLLVKVRVPDHVELGLPGCEVGGVLPLGGAPPGAHDPRPLRAQSQRHIPEPQHEPPGSRVSLRDLRRQPSPPDRNRRLRLRRAADTQR